jgi:hypothetical protein
MSIKNSNNTIWNRTRDLPTGSAVPKPTVPPPAIHYTQLEILKITILVKSLTSDIEEKFVDDTANEFLVLSTFMFHILVPFVTSDSSDS